MSFSITLSQSLPQSLLWMLPASYFIGSIPFGLLVGKWRGIDVRKSGSGNIGATNVGRLLGKKYFFLVFFLDLLKSLIPMLVASAIVSRIHLSQRDWQVYLFWLLVGFFSVIGHMFSIFLKFKGGKGVATSAGLMLGLVPYYSLPGAMAICVFIFVFFFSRYVSLASIVAAITFPLLYVAFGWTFNWPVLGSQLPLLIFACLIALLIVVKHRANISRLMKGTESKFSKSA